MRVEQFFLLVVALGHAVQAVYKLLVSGILKRTPWAMGVGGEKSGDIHMPTWIQITMCGYSIGM